MAETDLIFYEVLGRVALITMHRPPVNAVNYAFIDAIHAAWRRADKDPGGRAIVLTSALDQAFLAGIDIDAAFGSGEVFDPGTILNAQAGMLAACFARIGSRKI